MNARQKPVSIKDYNENGYYEEVEQKTFDSETITPEEMTELQYNLYEEDIDGGLQNIRVSPEELEKQREQMEYAKTFIDLKDFFAHQ